MHGKCVTTVPVKLSLAERGSALLDACFAMRKRRKRCSKPNSHLEDEHVFTKSTQ